jgi:hypothetical protein
MQHVHAHGIAYTQCSVGVDLAAAAEGKWRGAKLRRLEPGDRGSRGALHNERHTSGSKVSAPHSIDGTSSVDRATPRAEHRMQALTAFILAEDDVLQLQGLDCLQHLDLLVAYILTRSARFG